MRFLLLLAVLGVSTLHAQDRFDLRLVVKSNRPCLIKIDGRWEAQCNDVCVFTWKNYPDKVKRGTITAIQTGDYQPLSEPYVLVAGEKPGEIHLRFQPRLFRGSHEYPPEVDYPTRPLEIPTVTEYLPTPTTPKCDPPVRPEPTPPVVVHPPPSTPTHPPIVEVPAETCYWWHWEVYFWIGAFLLLLTLAVFSYWKWRVCRLWDRELGMKYDTQLRSSGKAKVVQ